MSFTDKLGKNQRNFAEEALLRTIAEDPNQTIGDIWKSLEDDADSEFMFELFQKLTIGRLVIAAAQLAVGDDEEPDASASEEDEKPKQKKKSRAQASTEVEEAEEEEDDDDEEEGEGDDDDFDDDDFDGDDDEDEDEEDEEDESDEEEAPKKRKSKKSAKSNKSSKSKSSKKDKAASSKKDDGHIPGLSDPKKKKKYQNEIKRYLKSEKARDYDSGKRSTEVRNSVGGSPKQVRENLNEMIEAEYLGYGGQARGMRYFLA